MLRYLHAVCSQHTLDLEPGDATQALLLSPKGKVEFAFRLAVLEKGVLLDTEATTAGALAERLARFVFRHDVTVSQPVAGAASCSAPAPTTPWPRPACPCRSPAGPASPVRSWSSTAPRRDRPGRPGPRPPPAWSGPGRSGAPPSYGSWSGSSSACPGRATS